MNEAVNAVIEFLKQYGLYGVLLIVIILLVHDPSRAEKLKLIFLTPLFRFLKWGTRQYLATRVGLSVSEFYRHQVSGLLSTASKWKFKIRWVSTPSDPVLKKNGTLILRLEETNDQARNILSATKVALSKTICPTLRSQIRPHVQNAIDLALLRKLTERLGKHAQPIFLKYFLQPQTENDAECAQLLTELIEVDKAGLFIAIFLEELSLLGDYAFRQHDRSDKTESIKKFLAFLLGVARREEFEEIELDHASEDFRLGILLLARTQRAARQGVTPYVKRINRKVREGCDSIYIMAFRPAITFLDKVVNVLRDDIRICVAKMSRVSTERRDHGLSDTIAVVQLTVGRGFKDAAFEEQVREIGLAEGDMVTGKIVDVAEQVALANINGVSGSITKTECDWATVRSCCDIFSTGDDAKFQIASIDHARGMLVLSRRFEHEDPFKSLDVPNVGDVVTVTVIDVDSVNLIGRRADGLEIQIPFLEVSWMTQAPENPSEFLNQKVQAVIYEVNVARHFVRASMRRLEENPWPAIHARFPAGSRFRGTVVEVNKLLHFVRVEIADGIRGILPAESMMGAGFEYTDFEETLILGQKLDVIVTKVFINKRRIRLDLQRNVAVNPSV